MKFFAQHNRLESSWETVEIEASSVEEAAEINRGYQIGGTSDRVRVLESGSQENDYDASDVFRSRRALDNRWTKVE